MRIIIFNCYLLLVLAFLSINVSAMALDADTLETIKCKVSGSIQESKVDQVSVEAIEAEISGILPEGHRSLVKKNKSKEILDSLFKKISQTDEPVKFVHEKMVRIFMTNANALYERYKQEEGAAKTDRSAEDTLENKFYILASLVSDILKDYIDLDEE